MYIMLMTRTKEAAADTLRECMNMTRVFGLTVSIPNTKFIVVGKSEALEEEKLPIEGDGGMIDWVSEFPYLGTLISKVAEGLMWRWKRK